MSLSIAMPYPHKLDEERILKEATRIVDADGIDGLSTRTLADRLGVRAPSLYRYFPDKATLVQAVARRFTAELTEQLAARSTLEGLASAYWAYALRYPHRYDALVRHGSTPDSERMLLSPEQAEPLLAIVSQFDRATPALTARVVRSYLHGAVMLHLLSPLADQHDEEEALALGIDILAKGLGTSSADDQRDQ